MYSPNYFEEQTNTYESIHFLNDEALSFVFCSEEEVALVDAKLICSSKTLSEELNLFEFVNSNEFGKNVNVCYFSNYYLNQFDCDDFSLEVRYDENNKDKLIKRDFLRQNNSRVVENVLNENFKSMDAEELSYYLVVLRDLGFIKEEEETEVYELLKNLRNNENKCWPSSDCDLEVTSEILTNLKLSGYDLDSRLVQDGKIYFMKNLLENREIEYEDLKSAISKDTYEFEIRIFDDMDSDLDCSLTRDTSDSINYQFSDSDAFDDMKVKKSFTDDFNFSCDRDVDEFFVKIYEDKIDSRIYSNQDEVGYILSEDDASKYSDYYFEFMVEDDFTSSNSCTLDIDGTTKVFHFDNSSSEHYRFLNFSFKNNINLDCAKDMDKIYLDVFGGLKEQVRTLGESEVLDELEILDDEGFLFRIDLDYSFLAYDKVTCELTVDSNPAKSYYFSENDKSNNEMYIDKKVLVNNLKLVCDRELDFASIKVYDNFNRIQDVKEFREIKNFNYNLPSNFGEYNCYGEDDTCSFKSSITALYVYGNELNDDSLVSRYVSSLVQEDSGIQKVDSDSEIEDTSLYLMYKNDPSIVQTLKFKQNNDGSWSDGNIFSRVFDTSFATISLDLISSTDSEHLIDAKKWIYYNEPELGWGSVQRNSYAYFAIKEQLKPYVKVSAPSQVGSEKEVVEIINPTLYDLKDVRIDFSDKMGEDLSFTEDLGDLNSKTSKSFNLTLDSAFIGKKSSLMKVYAVYKDKKETLLIERPIYFYGSSVFGLNPELNYKVSSDFRTVSVDIENKVDTYEATCNFQDPFSGQSREEVIDQNTFTLNFENNLLKEGKFNFDIDCTYEDQAFKLPVSFEVIKVSDSFTVYDDEIVISSTQGFSVMLASILNSKQEISAEIEGDFVRMLAPDTPKMFANGEERDFYFEVSNPVLLESLGNQSSGYVLFTSSEGFSKRVPITVDFGAQDDGGFSWLWFILIIVLVLVVGIGVLLTFRRKNYDENQEEYVEGEYDEFDLDGDFDLK